MLTVLQVHGVERGCMVLGKNNYEHKRKHSRTEIYKDVHLEN